MDTIYDSGNIEKLSTENAIQCLKRIDDKNYDEFQKITGIIFNEKYILDYKKDLYNVILKNNENTSFYAKLTGFNIFINILKLFGIFVAIMAVGATLLSIIKICLTMFSNDFLLELKKVFIDYHLLHVVGYLLSMILTISKNKYLGKYIQIFGYGIFYLVTLFLINEYKKYNEFILYGILIYSILIAIYQDNYIIGIFAIMNVFTLYGFTFGPLSNGYYAGYNTERDLWICLLISVILNIIILFGKVKVLNVLNVFRTGIYFWATLVGSIVMSIVSSSYYLEYTNKISYFIPMQILYIMWCMILIYIGSIYYISAYKNIGCVFLVLCVISTEMEAYRYFEYNIYILTIGLLLTCLLIRQSIIVMNKYKYNLLK